MKALLLSLVIVSCVFGQSSVDGDRIPTATARINNSGALSTKPVKAGTSLPATCSVGEFYNKTDAAANAVLYACTATNTWTPQGPGTTAAEFEPAQS